MKQIEGLTAENLFSQIKTAFGKNRFSWPWNVCLARSNGRLTSTDHKLSTGAFRFEFRAQEGS